MIFLHIEFSSLFLLLLNHMWRTDVNHTYFCSYSSATTCERWRVSLITSALVGGSCMCFIYICLLYSKQVAEVKSLYVTLCSTQSTLEHVIKCCYPKKVFPFKFSACIWNHSYISKKGRLSQSWLFFFKHSGPLEGCVFLMWQIFIFLLFEIDASCMLVVAFSSVPVCSWGNVVW